MTTAVADGVQEPPQASFTYDFTDVEQFTSGDVVSQIPGAIQVNAIRKSDGTTNILTPMELTSIAQNITGLNSDKQLLQLGKGVGANATWQVQAAHLYHPNDAVLVHPDGTKTLNQYPVTKLSLNVMLANMDAHRGGFFITKGMKPLTYDAANDVFTTAYSYIEFGLKADTTGLALTYQHHSFAGYSLKPNADNKLESITLKNYERPANTGSTAKLTAASTGKTLGGQVIDADGAYVAEDAAAKLNEYFTKKTSLTAAERWVNIECVENEANKAQMKFYFTFNFTDYSDFRSENESLNLPEVLCVCLKGTSECGYLYGNQGTTEKAFMGFGYWTGETGKPGNYVQKVSIEYDVSSYYAAVAEEFKTSFAAGFAAAAGSNGYFDQSDAAAVDVQLNAYNQLADGVKEVLKTDAAFAAQLSALQSAKAALEGGADYFDAFEHGLNYQVISKIHTDVEKNIGSSSAPNMVNIKDNLTETNVYSADAAKDAGDAEGNAFWGVHTDKTNAGNNALWLRKSFNAYNMVPTESGDRQGWPSVLYTLKDGILPEGAKIQKVTGKMWHYATYGDKRTMGVVHEYTDEYHWKAAVVSNARIFKLEKQAETRAHCDRNMGYYLVGTETSNTITNLAKDQWLDFSMEYSAEHGCYIFTLKGLNTAGEMLTYAVLTQACKPTEKFALVHGAPTQQCFDDIAVTLYKEPQVAPDVLGAKILKQATENGDQNLRIDFDFSNTILNGAEKNIVEYGAILQAGTQTKETLTNAANANRTVLSTSVTDVSEIPETYIVTITNSAENSGKRISAIAYVKDASGNYYYSANNSEVIKDGLAVKSVMGVMKAWYLDVSVCDASGVAAAVEAYKAADAEQTLTAEEIAQKVTAYANGTITTASAEYAACKQLLHKVFHYYYNAV